MAVNPSAVTCGGALALFGTPALLPTRAGRPRIFSYFSRFVDQRGQDGDSGGICPVIMLTHALFVRQIAYLNRDHPAGGHG
ncbi:hypothetical protein [Nakamurella sp. PAMC28650]|uniref:hypothetical protein n=1 Tax=Nakamurella sp. PAMC28650 TaxID=2762325 RepID=UPI00164EC28C|nr:hypothetical protein [Nakamurella sp. PAMC28650]QNK79926.1 hypothetical protein H7F38_17020 [Nakamurella sp. PAMC28650]